MKKSLYLLLLSLLIVAFCFTMTACNSDDSDDSDATDSGSEDSSTDDKPSSGACQHIFAGNYSSDASAHWFDCTNGCGAKFQAGDHVLGDPVVVTEATCTNPGESIRTCIVCDYKDKMVIKQKSHIPDGTFTEATDTTHTQGCKTCDEKKFTENHSFTSIGYDKAEHWKYCICGKKVDNAAHTWAPVNPDDNSVNRLEKCTHDGCLAKRTAPNPDHTCEFDTDIALGEVTKPATCKEQGIVTFKCKVEGCKAISTASIPVLPHSYDGDYSYNQLSHWHKCSGCGSEPSSELMNKEDHVFGKPTTDGFTKVYKCECGYTKSAESGGYIDPEGWT